MSTTAAHSTTALEESRTAERKGDRAAAEQSSCEVNVGSTERLASLIGGGTLAVLGLSRWSLGGLGLAAIGAGLGLPRSDGPLWNLRILGVSTAAAGDGRRLHKADRIPAKHHNRSSGRRVISPMA